MKIEELQCGDDVVFTYNNKRVGFITKKDRHYEMSSLTPKSYFYTVEGEYTFINSAMVFIYKTEAIKAFYDAWEQNKQFIIGILFKSEYLRDHTALIHMKDGDGWELKLKPALHHVIGIIEPVQPKGWRASMILPNDSQGKKHDIGSYQEFDRAHQEILNWWMHNPNTLQLWYDKPLPTAPEPVDVSKYVPRWTLEERILGATATIRLGARELASAKGTEDYVKILDEMSKYSAEVIVLIKQLKEEISK